MPFNPKIPRTRWILGLFTYEDMLDIGNVVVDAIKLRLSGALKCRDMPAKPLKAGRNGHRGPNADLIEHVNTVSIAGTQVAGASSSCDSPSKPWLWDRRRTSR
jgi:hypothetical protein